MASDWGGVVGVRLAAEAGNVAAPEGFELLFVDWEAAGSTLRRAALVGCWSTRFEDVAPVRSFPSFRGQRNFPGLYFAACMNSHVSFESWLERDHLMMLDFSPSVRSFSSQPFWLLWKSAGRSRRHAPDLFARLNDGTAVVIDVRADEKVGARDAEVFELTAVACESVGWRYRRVGALDEVLAANLRWLAGYRHRRCLNSVVAQRLFEVFAEPTPLCVGAERVGDRIAVLPTVFHLMWTGRLAVDLTSALLRATTLVAIQGVTR